LNNRDTSRGEDQKTKAGMGHRKGADAETENVIKGEKRVAEEPEGSKGLFVFKKNQRDWWGGGFKKRN